MMSNWDIKKVGDVCNTGAGGTPLKAHKDYYENGDIPWLLSGEVAQGAIYNSRHFITQKGFENSSARLFPENTVLVAMYGATAGQVGLLKFKSTTNQAICGIFPNERLIPNFIYYFFINKKDELVKQAVGGAQPNISQIKIKNTLIPLPPIPEQKHIVKILDEAFAAIDKAKANAEKNLQNSRELFDSYLNKVFANPEEDWIECFLNDYVKFIDYRGRTPEKTTQGMRLITAKNIKNGYLQKEPEEFVNPNIYDSWMTRGIPNKGDILFTTEAPLANVAQLDTDEKVVFAQRTIIFQPDPKFFNQSFLKYLLLSKPIKTRIIEKGTGATVKGIKAKLLKQIPIYFPQSLAKQERIVDKLNNLSDEIKKLETIYQQKLADLDELKKSILQKAFDGELTRNNG